MSEAIAQLIDIGELFAANVIDEYFALHNEYQLDGIDRLNFGIDKADVKPKETELYKFNRACSKVFGDVFEEF